MSKAPYDFPDSHGGRAVTNQFPFNFPHPRGFLVTNPLLTLPTGVHSTILSCSSSILFIVFFCFKYCLAVEAFSSLCLDNQKSLINAEIMLLRTNQIAENSRDFKLDKYCKIAKL